MLLLPVAVFFALIAIGLVINELSFRDAGVFFAIWIACRLAVRAFGLPPALLVACDVLLDIIIVFMIFGGDVRLT